MNVLNGVMPAQIVSGVDLAVGGQNSWELGGVKMGFLRII